MGPAEHTESGATLVNKNGNILGNMWQLELSKRLRQHRDGWHVGGHQIDLAVWGFHHCIAIQAVEGQ